MKSKIVLTVVTIALLMVPSYLCAAPLLEEFDTIIGFDIEIFSFDATLPPFTYRATLEDLSDIIPGLPPTFTAGFEMLMLTVTDLDGNILGSVDTAGRFMFDVDAGEKYLAWVQGNTGEKYDIGAFGVTVEPVPIPTTLMLLGSGLLGLLALKRRRG